MSSDTAEFLLEDFVMHLIDEEKERVSKGIPGENPDGQGFAGECKKRRKV